MGNLPPAYIEGDILANTYLVDRELDDSRRVPFAVLVRGFADAEFQCVVSGSQVSGEHDCSGIMQALAEAVEEVDFPERSIIDAGFNDACVRAGYDESADRLAREFDGCFRTGHRRAKEWDVGETCSLAARNVLPVRRMNFPAVVGRCRFQSLKMPV